MKYKTSTRILALLLLMALIIGIVPSVMAVSATELPETDFAEESAADLAAESAPQISPPVQSEAPAENTEDTDSDLTRTAIATIAADNGTMGKTDCVYFSEYQSPQWYCNRYHSGTGHFYGHNFFAAAISYHTIDGVYSYCIEPNVGSYSGQSYSGYDSDSAASDSYWMLEFDETQRRDIGYILACGYPSNDYGYGQQAQFAATQVLIWEVVTRLRYPDLQSCSNSTLYNKVKASIGQNFVDAYDKILSTIADSGSTVPSFANSSASSPSTIKLTLNTANNCYEATVTDSNGVLSHFDFTLSRVKFTKSGNSLKISVPADNTTAKGQTITGTSDLKDLDSVNPTIWENSTYQTVLTAGSVGDVKAYIKLDWEDAPKTGDLEVSKAVNYGTWKGFKFRLYGTSDNGKAVDMTATTDDQGKAYFKDVLLGTYTLEEVDPGQQYVKPKSQTVTIKADGTTSITTKVDFPNVWKRWQATVTKIDAETKTAQGNATLDGAEYTLYNAGKAVATYTVKNGGFTTNYYFCTESDSVYTLKETKAPPGYALDETVYKLTTSYSHYTDADNSFSVTVSDPVLKAPIKVDKRAVNTVTGEKQPEQGVTFEVYLKSAGSYTKAKDTERDIITIGADGTGTSKDLPYGTYCVRQLTGWDGYDIDENVYEVSVPSTTKGDNVLSLTNNIWTGTLSILKVDGDNKHPLSGAEFTLTGSDGSEQKAVTNDQGKVMFENLVYGVTYTWTETKAPKGYLLNEDNMGTWTVEEHDATMEITCEDFRRPGAIVVTKQNAGGDPLPGCTFLLEYLDGGTWKPVTARSADPITKGGCTSANLSDGCLTTDETGVVTFKGLWADEEIQYRLTEVAAPEGYSLLTEPVYEGTLPFAADAATAVSGAEEIIDGTAYFYTLPISVHNGRIYTMPMTGGSSGFPFELLALILIPLGVALIVCAINPCWFQRLCQN